jgi:hypothetical protein
MTPAGDSAMGWEDDELAVYEPKRKKAVEIKKLADARVKLLNHQLSLQWKTIREIFTIRCESINAKAGRVVLRSVDAHQDRLDIRRENESKIEGKFDAASRKIHFKSDAFAIEREYSLVITTHNHADSVAWFCTQTEVAEGPDEIVKFLLSMFLRAEQ